MAKKEDKKEKKVVLERTYIIPLRRQYRKAPRWKRTPRAVSAIRQFLQRHMKAETVKIGKYLNLKMWQHGMKNPPHKIQVEAQKDEDGLVKVEMVGAPKEKPKEEKKESKKEAEDKKSTKGKKEIKEGEFKESSSEKKEAKEESEIEVAVKDALSGKEEETKKAEKEELKTIKKEQPKAPKLPAQSKNVEQKPNAPASKG